MIRLGTGGKLRLCLLNGKLASVIARLCAAGYIVPISSEYAYLNDYSNLTNFDKYFYNNTTITELPHMDMSNAESAQYMIAGTTNLTTLVIYEDWPILPQEFAACAVVGSEAGVSYTTIRFLAPSSQVISFPTAGSSTGAFYAKSSRAVTIEHYNNSSVTGYDWKTDNVTATFVNLGDKE